MRKKGINQHIPELTSEKGILKGGFSSLSPDQLSRLRAGNSSNAQICGNEHSCQGSNTDLCMNESYCRGTNSGDCHNGLGCSDMRDSINAL